MPHGKKRSPDSVVSLIELRQRLLYHPTLGTFTWTDNPTNKRWKGKPSGTNSSCGYPRVKINGVKYSSHILAIYYVTGKYPTLDVDHIDHDVANYKYTNLREVTHCENMQNVRLSRDNTSGFKGVWFCKQYGKWGAKGSLNSVRYTLGYFDTPEEASEVYNMWTKANHTCYHDSRIV